MNATETEQAKRGVKRSHSDSYELFNSIDLALSKFFFSCNISFNVIESNLFKDFIKLLNPDYNIPSRKKLSN